MFSESRNSILTPNLTRCGTWCHDDHVVDDDDDDEDVDDDVKNVDDEDEDVDLWEQVNNGIFGGGTEICSTELACNS